MKALVNKGYAERAPLHRTENRTWYLPHFPVINAMKPGKYESFTTLPLKQRRHPVAVSADISEMFMQIKIKPEDRDALRYLWRGDKEEMKTY
ncbi:hypothetical protein EVAR_58454_1 [Eumeta japonica]|uniref:Uncharacterized protein n=1 Tax=Eumeta variegata TaxID=151549 RepID=A0A4C1Z333_EUMVA|nr:hypothetical protein EVAR_58454_1 [Eumeta japonica]